MSHIKTETVKGFDTVHPVVLGEGIKIAAQLLGLNGQQIDNFIYDWTGNKVTEFNGIKLICGIGAEGAANSHKFAGMGLAVDPKGKLAIVGDFYYDSQKKRRDELQQLLERVLGGACYFAARALIAQAKGQTTEVRINNETHQLQLVVQM